MSKLDLDNHNDVSGGDGGGKKYCQRCQRESNILVEVYYHGSYRNLCPSCADSCKGK